MLVSIQIASLVGYCRHSTERTPLPAALGGYGYVATVTRTKDSVQLKAHLWVATVCSRQRLINRYVSESIGEGRAMPPYILRSCELERLMPTPLPSIVFSANNDADSLKYYAVDRSPPTLHRYIYSNLIESALGGIKPRVSKALRRTIALGP